MEQRQPPQPQQQPLLSLLQPKPAPTAALQLAQQTRPTLPQEFDQLDSLFFQDQMLPAVSLSSSSPSADESQQQNVTVSSGAGDESPSADMTRKKPRNAKIIQESMSDLLQQGLKKFDSRNSCGVTAGTSSCCSGNSNATISIDSMTGIISVQEKPVSAFDQTMLEALQCLEYHEQLSQSSMMNSSSRALAPADAVMTPSVSTPTDSGMTFDIQAFLQLQAALLAESEAAASAVPTATAATLPTTAAAKRRGSSTSTATQQSSRKHSRPSSSSQSQQQSEVMRPKKTDLGKAYSDKLSHFKIRQTKAAPAAMASSSSEASSAVTPSDVSTQSKKRKRAVPVVPTLAEALTTAGSSAARASSSNIGSSSSINSSLEPTDWTFVAEPWESFAAAAAVSTTGLRGSRQCQPPNPAPHTEG